MGNRIIEYLKKNPVSSRAQVSFSLGLSERTTSAYLNNLEKLGAVSKTILPLGNEQDARTSIFYSAIEKFETSFEGLKTPYELIKYLSNDVSRLKNREYIYHYTKMGNIVKAIGGGFWHLGNPKFMNDRLEYDNGDKNRWRNIFFSSFMTEEEENIGMWSMYSQPWNKGVKVSIPSSAVKRWIRETSRLYEVSTVDYSLTGRAKDIDRSESKLASVIYCNSDRRRERNDAEQIIWSTVKNYEFKNAAHIPELTGYVKDVAWSYEKEIRLRVEFDNNERYQRVAISIPDYVIESMRLTPSPLFDGDFEKALREEVQRQIIIERSIFDKKLNIDSICNYCELKLARRMKRAVK